MITSPTPLAPQDAGVEKVSTLELFLDLVFVFTVTKITGLVSHPHGYETYWLAVLVFLSLMWIYDGFAWLTSNTSIKDDYQSWMMFAAMVGFFVMALAIPTVTGSGGVLFAFGLLLVTLFTFFCLPAPPPAAPRPFTRLRRTILARP